MEEWKRIVTSYKFTGSRFIELLGFIELIELLLNTTVLL
jgi:hypothetical protein